MRKFIVTGLFAALGAALLSIPAFASIDHHFTVNEQQTATHKLTPDTYRFKARLVDPNHPRNQVGHDSSVCKFFANSLVCRATVHLNGEIGGRGNIRAHGHLTGSTERLNVVGGTGDFRGVAGKVVLIDIPGEGSGLQFAIIR
jgi:hypothetical protein